MKTEAPITCSSVDLDNLCINTIRFLSVDAVEKPNSGHPGVPMGAAPMAYVLWTRFLRHNPASPHWFNRDRFVLPAGVGEHGSTHQPIELIRVMRGFGPEVRDFGPPGWIDFRTGHSCREKHRCH